MTPAIANWLFEKADTEWNAANVRLDECKKLLALHEHHDGKNLGNMEEACLAAVANHKELRRQAAELKVVVADLLKLV